jgi:hypothetical protein
MKLVNPLRDGGRRMLLSAVGLALGLTGMVAAASPAAADSAPAKDTSPAASHCTLRLGTGAVRCFSTLNQALSYASGGRVTGVPNDVHKAVTDHKVTEQINAPQATVGNLIVGIQYYWENYGAPSLTVWGFGDPCNATLADVDYYLSSDRMDLTPFGGLNWNNNIRSFIGYNNCWEKLYDFPNATGDTYGFTPYSSDLGLMRDRAEFISFS